MSKEINQENVELNKVQEESVVETAEKPVENKKVKKSEKVKSKKKERKPSKIKRMFKETGSELKKVTWPTFKQTMKKTGVVLGVVIFFGIILFAIDFVLGVGLKALAAKEVTAVEQWVAVGLVCLIALMVAASLIFWAVRRKRNRR